VSRISRFCEWLLRQSIVWGSIACLAFYALVVQPLAPSGEAQASDQAVIYRYFYGDGWEVKVVTAVLFFVGMAALAIKLVGLASQFASLHRIHLPTAPAGGQSVDDVEGLLAELARTPRSAQDSYLYRRLRSALDYVRQKRSADTLESQLRHLEDAAGGLMNQGYASIRVIASTIPIMGFLGTVIGITLAIFELSGSDIEKSLPSVIAGLSVAFDTTAQALALSIFLLFAKFGVERVEMRLLDEVDECTSRQLLGRFQQFGSETDPQVASIRRMSERLLETVETAIARQQETLGQSLSAANRRWEEMAGSVGDAVKRTIGDSLSTAVAGHSRALNEGVARHTADLERTLIRHAEILGEGIDRHTGALADALEQHTAVLTAAERSLADENRRHLSEVETTMGEAMLVASSRQEKLIKQGEDLIRELQVSLVEAAGATVAQQEQLVKQSDVLLKVVEATGQIRRLEEALNSNLSSLASSHRFEETVVSLSATLQLLSAVIGRPDHLHDEVQLTADRPSKQAA
jgi:biopolymer transport protein ExbB/TolQ